MPGGGLSFDGTRWVSSRSNFLVHVNVLARLFRGKMLAMLTDAHGAGQLKFFNTQAGLADKGAFKRFIAPLRHIKWVVYCKAPVAGPKQVLRYLSRYTHRVAISNRRLIAADDAGVAFRWKDYRADGPARWKTMRRHPHEFIRRFLLHVLPTGFHRIRHYGLLASANRAESIATARALLDVAPPAAGPHQQSDIAPDAPRVLRCPCPRCGTRMIVIEVFARGCEPRWRPTPSTTRSTIATRVIRASISRSSMRNCSKRFGPSYPGRDADAANDAEILAAAVDKITLGSRSIEIRLLEGSDHPVKVIAIPWSPQAFRRTATKATTILPSGSKHLGAHREPRTVWPREVPPPLA